MTNFEDDIPKQEFAGQDQSAEDIAYSFLERGDGVTFVEWAESNPDAEYRLWLTTRPDSTDLQQVAAKRLKDAERMTILKTQIGCAVLLSSVFIASAVFEAIENQLSATAVLGAFSLWAVGETRKLFKKSLPNEKLYRERGNTIKTSSESKLLRSFY